jgi:chromosome partitioning protein
MIVAIANQKGGVAKTTSTICLGGLLAQSDPCLVVDLDPQGNLTTGLGAEVADGQLSAYDVIVEQAAVAEAVVSTPSGLSLLPADISLAKGETEILTKVGSFLILKERLEPVQNQYRHVLIDCPPSLGLLTVNALAAAEVVLIPVQCQFFALKGLAALLETIGSIQKRLNPNLRILGVLPTMAEKTVMTRDVLASLKRRLPDVPIFDPVPKSVKFAESNLAGEPIHRYTDDPKLAAPYQAIARLMRGE